jgi:hypothetical protein
MEQRFGPRGMRGGWSSPVVVGYQDGRGWAGAGVSDRQVGSAMREVEMGIWWKKKVNRAAVKRATGASVCRSCDVKNLS